MGLVTHNSHNSHIDTIRFSGVPIRYLRLVLKIRLDQTLNRVFSLFLQRLHYYDSHRFDPTIRYNQSILPTVLVLPSAQYKIKDYSYLIDKLHNEKKLRVVALVFPGMK